MLSSLSKTSPRRRIKVTVAPRAAENAFRIQFSDFLFSFCKLTKKSLRGVIPNVSRTAKDEDVHDFFDLIYSLII